MLKSPGKISCFVLKKKNKEKKLEHREVTKNFYLDQSVATLTDPTFLDFNFIFSLELFFLAYAFA